jgi:hypothetical protein
METALPITPVTVPRDGKAPSVTRTSTNVLLDILVIFLPTVPIPTEVSSVALVQLDTLELA